MSLRWEFVDRHSVVLAASLTKVLWGLLLVLGLLAIVYWILRSIGIDRNTPPSMVWRKILAFARSFYRPLSVQRQWKKAARLEESQKLDAAVDVYVQLFDYDGLLSTRASVAIHNDRCLEHIEEIGRRVGYPYPVERSNRLREDMYDYFLVKTKYLSPSDYDGTPLIRAENEHRFFDKLNLRQEEQFIEDFREFIESYSTKLRKHIVTGAPPVEGALVSVSSLPTSLPEMGGGSLGGALSGSYDASASALASRSVGMSQASTEFGATPMAPAPGIFGGSRVDDSPLPPPPDLFGGGGGFSAEPNPFSLDDPRVPHHDATGRLHKLPGAADDTPFHQGLRDVEFPMQEEPTRQGPIPQPPSQPISTPQPPSRPSAPPPSQPPMQPSLRPGVGLGVPQPTGGFPGLNLGGPSVAAPAFSQATGGFPGLGQGAITPAAPAAPAFPQATGGFPGLAAPSQPFSVGGGAGANVPKPTGGFPGFANPAIPAPGSGSQPPGMPNFPQPTGGFPGFSAGNAPAAPAFPQATGGFPGLGAGGTASPVSPAPASFPQSTGGFPGFGQGGALPPLSGTPNFPQSTGGFPGFGTPGSLKPSSNPPAGEGKK